MAHFAVLVITENRPTKDDLEDILLPFYFGEPDPKEWGAFVRFDWTDEVQARVDELGLEAALEEFGLKVSVVADEGEFPSDEEPWFVVVRDGRLIKAVGAISPHRKWDYWQLGGRFTGLLEPGYEPTEDPDNIETCRGCGGTGKRTDHHYEDGCNLCRGSGRSLKQEDEWKQIGNQAAWHDIDLDALRDASARQAGETYDEFRAIVGARAVWESRASVFARLDDEAARAFYWSQPLFARLKEGGADGRFAPHQDSFLASREAYIQRARDNALVTYAVVKNGKWYEREDDGFGSHPEEEKAWCVTVEALLADLSETAWLSVVDCHI